MADLQYFAFINTFDYFMFFERLFALKIEPVFK